MKSSWNISLDDGFFNAFSPFISGLDCHSGVLIALQAMFNGSALSLWVLDLRGEWDHTRLMPQEQRVAFLVSRCLILTLTLSLTTDSRLLSDPRSCVRAWHRGPCIYTSTMTVWQTNVRACETRDAFRTDADRHLDTRPSLYHVSLTITRQL